MSNQDKNIIPDLFAEVLKVQNQRGQQYDSPDGERSMAKIVTAFNAITGHTLTEPEGWLFMQILKDVRQWQTPGKMHEDSCLDGTSFCALKVESIVKLWRTPK